MKNLNWIWVGIFICCLIGVRVLESDIFYDPFLNYFKTSHSPFPEFEWGRIIISHIFRFFLNFIFSLEIIHFLFKNEKWTFQAGVLILSCLAIFFPIYLYCLYTEFQFGELFAFYIRRIVIQPIPVLLLVPIFYYRKSLED
ncbi:MAG: exosortase F system-associated protein [Flavobacteriaceae bacterium]|nr:exosortase F system-associated protein [Flavobacteriaceae bacterium]